VNVSAPWGSTANDRVEAVVGTDGTSIWIDWKNRVTAACTSTYVGPNNNLSDDVSIVLTDGNDRISFAGTGTWTPASVDLCGYGALTLLTTNNHFFFVTGGSGDDRILLGSQLASSPW